MAGKVPPALVNKLGIAIGQRRYKAYCDLVASPRYRRVMNAGGRPQRLLFASTGTKDPKASDVMYVEALAAPFTVNTMPEGTLLGVRRPRQDRRETPADGGDCEAVLAQFKAAGVDVDALAAQLQDEGAEVVREVVERADGRARGQERGAGQGGVRRDARCARSAGRADERPGRSMSAARTSRSWRPGRGERAESRPAPR